MGESRSSGRERILDAAERLMAERGIAGVSLREINTAAAQKNASSVQYHFGDRAGLVEGVLQRHMQRADVRRNEMLDELESRGRIRPADVVAAVVEPLAAELETSGGRAYLQLLDQILDRPEVAALDQATQRSRSLDRAGRALIDSMQHLPRAVAGARRDLCAAFLLRSLADRARSIEAKRKRGLGHDAFVANLIDVLVAVLTTPASAASRRVARSRA